MNTLDYPLEWVDVDQYSKNVPETRRQTPYNSTLTFSNGNVKSEDSAPTQKVSVPACPERHDEIPLEFPLEMLLKSEYVE